MDAAGMEDRASARGSIFARDLRIAVDPPDLGRVELTVRVVTTGAPDPGLPVLFCVPGMSYGKEYWDLPLDGYSFARAAAAAGHVVVAADNLGTGASTRRRIPTR